MSDSLYIRFDGRLGEDLRFERRLGWETPVVVRRAPEGDGEYVVDLRDDQGEVLVEVAVHVDFDSGCEDEAHEMRSTRVVAHLPLHADTHELVFHRSGRTIHREEVAPKPPVVEIVGFDRRDDDRIDLAWKADHAGGSALRYRVLFVSSDGERSRGFPVVTDTRRTSAVIDTRDLPGGTACRLTVLASDGLRSAVAVTKPFAVDGADPAVEIQAPDDKATLPSGQAVSACGRAYDAGGGALPLDGLTWRLDGEVVSEGDCVIALHDVDPGDHRLELSWVGDGGATVVDSRSFTVAAESAGQAELRAILGGVSS